MRPPTYRNTIALLSAGLALLVVAPAGAQPLPGGSLDPTSIPKYVTPLVIPPVMDNDGSTDSYDIAVRQFQQQILPGGIWNSVNGRSDPFPATTVWSYGPAADPAPTGGVAPAANSQFNYPAYTLEAPYDTDVDVRWINDLVDRKGRYLEHLLPVDQTVHWANPPMQCISGPSRTDCAGISPSPYEGPVPIVTHVHGAHVQPDSDGYPEAWWLPAAKNIPQGFASSGTLFDDVTGSNPGNLGYADFSYSNDQPAATLWYHDHTLGMTRSNVYAGPAGFWLIRGGPNDGGTDVSDNSAAVLPGPAPVAGQAVLDLNVPGNAVRNMIREIPIVIQDRSFNTDGSLFYPADRAFFEGLTKKQLKIQFTPQDDSDVLPIWNPEAFFNVMVVNGVSWPKLDVAQDRYRFRLLNGCNSRFLNLALVVVASSNNSLIGTEVPFYQIGAEQGFLPNVVRIQTGEQAVLTPGGGETPVPTNSERALLMGLAERADVIVDFSGLPDGTVVEMRNTAPDEPFGGFPEVGEDLETADPSTTGQVMRFVVDDDLNGASGSTDGTTTDPANLALNAEGPLGGPDATRSVSLNERESEAVCVPFDPEEDEFILDKKGKLKQIGGVLPGPDFEADCAAAGGAPFGPTEALLGTVSGSGEDATGNALKWTDTSGASTPVQVTLGNGTQVTVNVTENPTLGDTEDWEMYNFTADAHPIHLHLVRFQVIDRTAFDGSAGANGGVQPGEDGYKDTVISYPDEITTIRANFDIPGLYVWHCHIVEHEDNEMMRPYVVSAD